MLRVPTYSICQSAQRGPCTSMLTLRLWSICVLCAVSVGHQVLRWDKASDEAKADATAAFQALHTAFLASLTTVTATSDASATAAPDDSSTAELVAGVCPPPP